MAKEDEGRHEHVCSRCLRKYSCDDPDDADLPMGLCPDHRDEDSTEQPTTEKGSEP